MTSRKSAGGQPSRPGIFYTIAIKISKESHILRLLELHYVQKRWCKCFLLNVVAENAEENDFN